MPTLANARHERFAQELAKGQPAYRAHKDAGLSGNRPDASKLQRHPNIVQRVAEIMDARHETERQATEKAAEALAIDKQWVLARLVENADRAMQAVAVKTSQGSETGEYKYDGSVANRALELIGKELGMFIDRKEVGVPGEFAKMSEDDLRRHVEAEARALGFGSAGASREGRPSLPH